HVITLLGGDTPRLRRLEFARGKLPATGVLGAELFQSLPSARQHHHARPGGCARTRHSHDPRHDEEKSAPCVHASYTAALLYPRTSIISDGTRPLRRPSSRRGAAAS